MTRGSSPVGYGLSALVALGKVFDSEGGQNKKEGESVNP